MLHFHRYGSFRKISNCKSDLAGYSKSLVLLLQLNYRRANNLTSFLLSIFPESLTTRASGPLITRLRKSYCVCIGCNVKELSSDWLTWCPQWSALIDWVKVLRPTRHKNRSFRRRCFQPMSWLSSEKLNQTRQKQCICSKIYYNTKWTHKIKARFGRLLWPPA